MSSDGQWFCSQAAASENQKFCHTGIWRLVGEAPNEPGAEVQAFKVKAQRDNARATKKEIGDFLGYEVADEVRTRMRLGARDDAAGLALTVQLKRARPVVCGVLRVRGRTIRLWGNTLVCKSRVPWMAGKRRLVKGTCVLDRYACGGAPPSL